jgi:hypothetical protein
MAVMICPKHGEQLCVALSEKAFNFAIKFEHTSDKIVPLVIMSADEDNFYYHPYAKICKDGWVNKVYNGGVSNRILKVKEELGNWILKEELGDPPLTGLLNKEGDVMIFDGDAVYEASMLLANRPVCCQCFEKYLINGHPLYY